MKRVLIITPVYNDWAAFGRLMQELEAAMPADSYEFHVIAVDDCSTYEVEPLCLSGSVASVSVVRLTLNVGHQRAIAVGLVEAARNWSEGLVAVMDSDGEDLPSELKRLIDAAGSAPEVAVVAQRRKRSESAAFRILYAVYVQIFRALTGSKIDFGNFSILTASHVQRLVHDSNIWNNFAATLIHAKIPIFRIPTSRGKRYAGKPQMRFVALISHGLGAISVFAETVFIRILLASLGIFAASAVSALAVLCIRVFSDLAIPGWTTNVMGFLVLLSAQAVMLPILVAFLLLSNRSVMHDIPKEHASRLVEERKRIYERPLASIAAFPGRVA